MAARQGRDSPLSEYRRKRDASRTPEPVLDSDPDPIPTGQNDMFVIQEHHARALHWDLRLERDGVLVSWAVPKGMPADPGTNHLAVQTEDHPLEYATFSGEIPAGEYGGGRMAIWDRGRYETEKWSDREVMVILHGERVQGRHVLFATGGKNWMIHRMDPPARPDWASLPDRVRPMLAVPGELPPPSEDDRWSYELKWDGVRAVAYVSGGRVRLLSRNDLDISRSYPEVRALGEALGSMQAVLDGELVSFDERGRPSFSRLQERMHVNDSAAAARLASRVPVVYLLFDVLHLDGRSTLDLPYAQRRELLDGLALGGAAFQTPPAFEGPGADVLRASRENGLEGVVAKRQDSAYRPGRRSPDWRKVKHVRTQEVIVVGWRPGKGRRAAGIGSLLLAVNGPEGLQYVGGVGTGFTERMLADLATRLAPLERATSPLGRRLTHPPTPAEIRDVQWVRPRTVGEVAFAEWTPDGRLRHPSWRGLRPDKYPAEVRPEA